MTFHEKLVKLRKLKGLTQDEFASAVGVSRQAVYKWESGQSYPEVTKLLEIKMIFGISIDDLLDESYEVILPDKPKKRRGPKPTARPQQENAPAVLPLTNDERPVYDAAPTVAEQNPVAPQTVTPVAAEVLLTETAPATAEVKIEEEVSPTTEEKEEACVAANVGATTAGTSPADEPTAPSTVPSTPTATEEPIPTATAASEKGVEEPTEKKRGFFQRLFGRK